MKPIVLYSSKGGNTGKVGSEIASELDCPCIKITKDFDSSTINLNDFDLVFIGTGNYAAKPNHELLNFLNEMNLGNSGKDFALFMTWFGRGTSDKAVYNKVKTTVEAKGQKILEKCYYCLGEGHSTMERGVAHLIGHANSKGHPDAEDLSNARKWAKELSKSI